MKRKTNLIIVFLLAMFILFSLDVQAQTLGCCCNPEGAAQRGTMQDIEIEACDAGGGYTSFIPEGDIDFMEYIFMQPLNILCDRVCPGEVEEIEFVEGVAPECGSPTYVPEPEELVVNPVKGESRFSLFWQQNCTNYVDHYEIYRCEVGLGCTFGFLDNIQATTYEDQDVLLWNTDYRYKVVTIFQTPISDSAEAETESNTGDLECMNKLGMSSFCLGFNSYYQFKDYLEVYGYGGSPGDSFIGDSFATTANQAFSARFNKGFFCNEANELLDDIACGQDEVCVATPEGSECREVSDCTQVEVGGYFGLNYNINLCEGPGGDETFCFFDRSHSLANDCYSCQIGMSCLDYRSQGACGRDNCGVGGCEWRPIYGSIGIGICVDTRISGCEFCEFKGSPGMNNLGAYNEVYDQCTQTRANALETTGPCLFDPGTGSSKSCNEISCKDYRNRANECKPPDGGVQLDADNNVVVESTDICDIGVCEWEDGIGCFKNADGKENIAPSMRDCKIYQGDADALERCEKDYFPPRTNVLATSEIPGRTDYLEIYRYDREEKGMSESFVLGEDGYPTFFCIYVKDEEAPCTPTTPTAAGSLNLDNRFLKEGNIVVAPELSTGMNTFRFYSQDIHNNLEVIQEVDFIACDNCQGPRIIEEELLGGNLVNDIWYTKESRPNFRILFNSPITMIYTQFVQGNTIYAVSGPGNCDTECTFTGTQTLNEGTYVFRLDGKNEQDITMFPAGEIDFVYDITPPSLIIFGDEKEINGEVYNNHDIHIRFQFDEEVFIEKAEYTANAPDGFFSDDFITVNMSPELSSGDNMVFDGDFDFPEGPIWMSVKARDYAGNEKEYDIVGFNVQAEGPQIRLKSPTYGVSPTLIFDLIAETLNPATCRFWLSTQGAPVPPLYTFLEDFDSAEGGINHIKNDVSRIQDMGIKYPLIIWCIDGEGQEMAETFDIWVDDSDPEITNAEADPDPIIQYPYKTHLKVTTASETFCKYSDGTLNLADFDTWERFPGYGRIGKTAHDIEIDVDDLGDYSYGVACIGLNEKGPVDESILFSVVPGVPFEITSTTPRYFGSRDVTLGVSTNKDSLCYYSKGGLGVGSLLGEGVPGQAHTGDITETDGTHTYTITCATGGETVINGTVEMESVDVEFTVDTSPPVMDEVDDSSPLDETPDITYDTQRLRVKFVGHDFESGISRYRYRLLERGVTTPVEDWTSSTKEDDWVIVSGSYTDGSTYEFEVKAQNIVGLNSTSMKSDGIKVDSGTLPDYCTNGQLDAPLETDIDCGGTCFPCGEGSQCSQDIDCDSQFCNQGVCAAPSCSDGIQNGQETGIDCGGVCDTCTTGGTCLENADCATGFCDTAGQCAIPQQCEDGFFNGDETDIDCGGSCGTKCADGKGCLKNSDCVSGSRCETTPSGNMCTSEIEEADADGDGIPDWWEEKYCGSTTGCDPNDDLDQDGLTNAQEYNYYKQNGKELDPTDPDTDGDGASDLYEIEQGTDPTDPDDYPIEPEPEREELAGYEEPSDGWLWILLLLLVIIILIVAGYFFYQYKQEVKVEKKPPVVKREEKPAPLPFIVPKKPVVKPAKGAEKIKGLFKPEKPQEFVSLEDIEASKRKEEHEKQWRPRRYSHN